MKKDTEEKLAELLAETTRNIEELTELVDTIGAAAELFEMSDVDSTEKAVH